MHTLEAMARRLVVAVCIGSVLALAGPGCVTAQPEGAAQVTPPSPPPAGPPPGPSGIPDGQWVYTQQYGWIWMTYADAYAYVPPEGYGEPLEYVYYPSYGWTWIAAPWVWGVGPWPHFGPRGPKRFAWYSHEYWRRPSRWQYRPAPERGGVARGVRPAPSPRQARRPERARGGDEHRDRGGKERRGDEGARGDGEPRGGVAPRR